MSYADWQATHLAAYPAEDGALDNPNEDALPNHLVYTVGILRDTDHHHVQIPKGSIQNFGGTDYLSLI